MASFNDITQAVCEEFGITSDQLFSKNRSQAPIAFARATAIYLAWRLNLGRSWSAVGRLFGRDRTSVRDAVQKVLTTLRSGEVPDPLVRLIIRFKIMTFDR